MLNKRNWRELDARHARRLATLGVCSLDFGDSPDPLTTRRSRRGTTAPRNSPKQAADDNLAFQKEQYEWLKPHVQDQLENRQRRGQDPDPAGRQGRRSR